MRILPILAVLSLTAQAGELVQDEALRARVIQLAFAGAKITHSSPTKVIRPYEVKGPAGRVIAREADALAGGSFYDIVGTPAPFEKEFADHIDAQSQPFSDRREAEMELYRWEPRGGEASLVAVLSYSFVGANPARCCLAIGRILLLTPAGDRLLDDFRVQPHAFGHFTEIRFIPSSKSGTELLMFGATSAPVAASAVVSVVLDVTKQEWRPLLAVDTRLEYFGGKASDDDVHTLSLDLSSTAAAGGRRFYFTRETWMRKGKLLANARKDRVSYPAGSGLPLGW